MGPRPQMGGYRNVSSSWCGAWGCTCAWRNAGCCRNSLCGGHRLAHQEIRQLVTRALPQCEHDPIQRMQILMDVQEWFHSHRHGVDAIAYARADAQQKQTKSIRQSPPLLQAHR